MSSFFQLPALPADVPVWAYIIPLLLLPVAVVAVRQQQAAKLLKTKGIGRGAPGFQTGVRKLAVTPEVAAKLRRGETVTDEELKGSPAATSKTTKSKAPSSTGSNRSVKSGGRKSLITGTKDGNVEEDPELLDAPPPAQSTRSARRKSEIGGSLAPTPTKAATATADDEFLPEHISSKPSSTSSTRRRASNRKR